MKAFGQLGGSDPQRGGEMGGGAGGRIKVYLDFTGLHADGCAGCLRDSHREGCLLCKAKGGWTVRRKGI